MTLSVGMTSMMTTHVSSNPSLNSGWTTTSENSRKKNSTTIKTHLINISGITPLLTVWRCKTDSPKRIALRTVLPSGYAAQVLKFLKISEKSKLSIMQTK